MGDARPLPGGCEAVSLLGTSPEQRKRSIPSGPRVPEASAGLSFPPLWETSGLSLVCDVCCDVLYCVVLYRVLCCVVCVVCDVLCCGVLS